MSHTLIIAPNKIVLSQFCTTTEYVEKGAISQTIEWFNGADEFNENTPVDNLVKATQPNVDVVIQKNKNDTSSKIVALLPALEDFLIVTCEQKPLSDSSVNSAFEQWLSYFMALQQHQYAFTRQFEIKLLDSSFLAENLQPLRPIVRCALMSDSGKVEVLEQFQGFKPNEPPIVWKEAITSSLRQYKALDSSEKNYNSAQMSLAALSKENERLSKCVSQEREETQRLTRHSQATQEELEIVTIRANSSADELTKLENSYSEVKSLLVKSNAQYEELSEQALRQRKENALLTSSSQKAQEALETAMAEAKNSKKKLAKLKEDYKALNSSLVESNNSIELLTGKISENENENVLLTLQVKELQDALDSVSLEEKESKLALANIESEFRGVKKSLTSVKTSLDAKNSQVKKQDKENTLLTSQLQQLQEEIEIAYEQLEERHFENQSINEELDSLKEKLFEVSEKENSKISNKSNNEMILQISQLQEELEKLCLTSELDKQASVEKCRLLEEKLANYGNIPPELVNELPKTMSEQELLELKIAQLQEELEFYFTEYQQLKLLGSEKNSALSSFKTKVGQRFPRLVLSEAITLVGGIQQAELERITIRFTGVDHGAKHWESFSMSINDRKGLLDIEFHAPDEKRIYPLSTFVKTGSNKVCDFSLLSPFTAEGKRVLEQLSNEDRSLLIGILEELQSKLVSNQVIRTDKTAQQALNVWPERLEKLTQELKLFLSNPVESKLSFKKLTLKQNMVAERNEHLLISIDGLQAQGKSFSAYDLKVGAKQIKESGFTHYGSLEFRELKNKEYPLASWPPTTKDKWGLKLVIDLPEKLTGVQQQIIENLLVEDREFIKELLKMLAERLHTIDLKNLKLNQPLENWQRLIANMATKF